MLASLKNVLRCYELLVNNKTDFLILPESRGVSIIDPTLTSPDMGLLCTWKIPEEYES